MKNILLVACVLFSTQTISQNIGIGTGTPNANAKLEISDTARGLLIPRIDAIHRLGIPHTKDELRKLIKK